MKVFRKLIFSASKKLNANIPTKVKSKQFITTRIPTPPVDTKKQKSLDEIKSISASAYKCQFLRRMSFPVWINSSTEIFPAQYNSQAFFYNDFVKLFAVFNRNTIKITFSVSNDFYICKMHIKYVIL